MISCFKCACNNHDINRVGPGEYGLQRCVSPERLSLTDDSVNMDTGVLLETNFILFPKLIPNVKVTLTRRGIHYGRQHSEVNRNPDFVSFRDVVGCDCLRGKRSEDPSAYLCIYSYPHRRKAVGKKTLRRREVITFQTNEFSNFAENFKLTDKWRRTIVCCLRGLLNRDLGKNLDIVSIT